MEPDLDRADGEPAALIEPHGGRVPAGRDDINVRGAVPGKEPPELTHKQSAYASAARIGMHGNEADAPAGVLDGHSRREARQRAAGLGDNDKIRRDIHVPLYPPAIESICGAAGEARVGPETGV